MNPYLNDWIHLLLRWVHIFASILWVGTTFYFTWLDGRFTELEKALADAPTNSKEKSEKRVWMVHSGGFYVVEKQRAPQLMPQTLHWFKWEAAITWLSGLLLFAFVYYHGGLMIELDNSRISNTTAVLLSVALMIVGWFVYDLLWSSRLFAKETVGVVLSFILIVLAAYGLSRWFSGRAAYIQVGAMFGTIMAANVWVRILPAQRRMVRALNEGKPPDLAEGARAKTRSKHNTFIVIPTVFLMMSNHFPVTTYGSRHGWIVLSAMVLLGGVAAKVIRRA